MPGGAGADTGTFLEVVRNAAVATSSIFLAGRKRLMLASGRVRKSGSGAAYDAAMAVAVVFKQKMATLAFNITADRRDSAHAGGMVSRHFVATRLSMANSPWTGLRRVFGFLNPGFRNIRAVAALFDAYHFLGRPAAP